MILRIRPWNNGQCIEHYEKLRLSKIVGFPAPKQILDVGFGPERRSALALRSVFPKRSTQIVAIDNDLKCFSDDKDTPPLPASSEGVKYLFSDVDLLDIPEGRVYDMVVFCMSLFCLQNPLRAIGTVATRALKKGGFLIITQRDDPVMRALCDANDTGGRGEIGENHDTHETEEHIRHFWRSIISQAKADGTKLVFPWRFKLVCPHEPLMGFLADIGFREQMAVKVGGQAISDHRVLDKAAHVETFGSVLGGQDKDHPPQYSKMRWAWEQFRDKTHWPDVGEFTDTPLGLTHITLASRVFQLVDENAGGANHPFSTYTAPLKTLPRSWASKRVSDERLEQCARDIAESWICPPVTRECENEESAPIKDRIKAFYLLSPHGVGGEKENPFPQPLYERDMKPMRKDGMSELALSSYLEVNDSPSVVVQFYRLNSMRFWPENMASSMFMKEAVSDVQMLAFPIICSEDVQKDIEDIRISVLQLEKNLNLKGATEKQRADVAKYIRGRGVWMKDNDAWGLYYYYRQNPSPEDKPVSRGASLLVTGPLPIETTLEFLVMAEEVVGNYQSQRYIYMLNQGREFNDRAGRSALLVRSLSHHLGSHVLANREYDAAKKLQPKKKKSMLGEDKENEYGPIDYKVAAWNLYGDSRFYTYLRERMEFLALLSLHAPLWSMPVTGKHLVSFLNNDVSHILRDNIGANELIVFAPYEPSDEIVNQVFALPWGTTGRQAFCTFVEGVIRNACKHGHIPANPDPDKEGKTQANLAIEIVPEVEGHSFWLYCGVIGQAVKAKDAAAAILCKMRHTDGGGEDPIRVLNELLALKRDCIDERPKNWITTTTGEYSHGALGILEMSILAEFLSAGKEGLRVKEVGGNLFMGVNLTKPKGMHKPLSISTSLDADFAYEYESYVVEDDIANPRWHQDAGGLPPLPLGPRTLYVTNTDIDPKYAHVKNAVWNSCAQKDQETVAKMILETRHHACDFRVIIDGPIGWLAGGMAESTVSFVDEKLRRGDPKAWLSKIENNARTLVLAHAVDTETVNDILAGSSELKKNVTVLPISKGDRIAHQYVFEALRQGMVESLRLLLFEAIFVRYEIYDNRIHDLLEAEFATDPRVMLKREDDILKLRKLSYSNDIFRMVHVTPWNELSKSCDLDWKRFYPNIIFHTGRGGEASARESGWGFPRLDYSSLVGALTSKNKTDSYITLALISSRIGCTKGG